MFAIGFKEDLVRYRLVMSKADMAPSDLEGVISLSDEHYETFVSQTHIFSKKNYHDQWIAGIERLHKCNVSVLITNYYGSNNKYPFCGEWWILYKGIKENSVIFHNQLIPKETFQNNQNVLANWHQYLPKLGEYTKYSEDGDEISEWELDEKALYNYLPTIRNKEDRLL